MKIKFGGIQNLRDWTHAAQMARSLRWQGVQLIDLNRPDDADGRASITFPPDLYETFEQIAQQKKVLVAWVVRDAAEKYITNKWPVLAKEKQFS